MDLSSSVFVPPGDRLTASSVMAMMTAWLADGFYWLVFYWCPGGGGNRRGVTGGLIRFCQNRNYLVWGNLGYCAEIQLKYLGVALNGKLYMVYIDFGSHWHTRTRAHTHTHAAIQKIARHENRGRDTKLIYLLGWLTARLVNLNHSNPFHSGWARSI